VKSNNTDKNKNTRDNVLQNENSFSILCTRREIPIYKVNILHKLDRRRSGSDRTHLEHACKQLRHLNGAMVG